jgi:hypothetical protein
LLAPPFARAAETCDDRTTRVPCSSTGGAEPMFDVLRNRVSVR